MEEGEFEIKWGRAPTDAGLSDNVLRKGILQSAIVGWGEGQKENFL